MSRTIDFDDGFTTETPPTDIEIASQAELDAHINDTTAAHAASAVSFTPVGTVAATNAQTAIAEVATDAAAALSSHAAATATHGIAGAIVGTSDTQTLSAKTFSDPVTLTEVSSPSAPAASRRKLYPKSDGKLYHMGSDGVEKAVGSGSGGGLNLLTLGSTYAVDNGDDADLEATIGRWSVYADAAATTPVDMTGGSPGTTVARSTSSPLNGAASLLMDLGTGSSRQGEGAMLTPVYIPPGYRGRTVQFSAVFSITGAITDGDVVPYAYDVTNSVLITPYVAGKLLGSSGKMIARLDIPSTCAQLRIGFHVARTATTALSIKLDDLKLTDEVISLGLSGSNTQDYVTSWTASTSNPSIGNGTLSSKFSVQGDRVKGQLRLVYGSTSTAGTGVWRFSPPPGYTPSTQKNSFNSSTPLLNEIGRGTVFDTGAFSAPVQVVYNVSAGVIQAGYWDDGSGHVDIANDVGASTPMTWANGDELVLNFEYAVAQDANVTMAQSSTFKISSYLANGTRVTSAPTKLGEYRTQYFTTGSAITLGEATSPPTPSVADGMRIYARAWASTLTTSTPCKWDIFVGKNKNVKVEGYGSTGRTGTLDISPYVESSSADFGLHANYDPTTGVVTVFARNLQGSGTHYVGRSAIDGTNTGTSSTDGYFDIVVSENALAVGSQNPRSMVRVNTGAGHGSTNTKIRRFTNAVESMGNAITYADSSTNGTTFTINEDGLYAMSYWDTYSGGVTLQGITKNSSQLTTDIDSTTASNILAEQHVAAANHRSHCSATVYLPAGTVIRAHTRGQNDITTAEGAGFIITKVHD